VLLHYRRRARRLDAGQLAQLGTWAGSPPPHPLR